MKRVQTSNPTKQNRFVYTSKGTTVVPIVLDGFPILPVVERYISPLHLYSLGNMLLYTSACGDRIERDTFYKDTIANEYKRNPYTNSINSVRLWWLYVKRAVCIHCSEYDGVTLGRELLFV